jgi:hypothetical protein
MAVCASAQTAFRVSDNVVSCAHAIDCFSFALAHRHCCPNRWLLGWLWSVWGMLLSIPIIVIVKVVSQHVEQLHPLAERLGD